MKSYLYQKTDNSMRKTIGSIPVNKFGDDPDTGISIERISFESLPDIGDWEQPERHDRHSFFLLLRGIVTMEIDFQVFEIESPSIIYMHPDQVHRIISFDNVTVCAWAADNNHLNPDYLKLLDVITPVAPIGLEISKLPLLTEAALLCLKIASGRKDRVYQLLLKDSINSLIGLVLSLYLENVTPADNMLRSESVTKSFREALVTYFTLFKRPAAYAEKLNLSLTYLNECVKNTTGHPVTYHIQQRIVLEAKRLLYHSDLSLKEIAAKLGYDDYAYFSRLFAKVAGKSPSTFRRRNHD